MNALEGYSVFSITDEICYDRPRFLLTPSKYAIIWFFYKHLISRLGYSFIKFENKQNKKKLPTRTFIYLILINSKWSSCLYISLETHFCEVTERNYVDINQTEKRMRDMGSQSCVTYK